MNAAQKPLSVLFFEVNEAEKYFLEKFVAQGKLPNFARCIEGGKLMRTRIPTWDAGAEKAWRHISPWIIWPSVYTGMTPEQHGIVGFGQDTSRIRGRCVWDVLDSNGISVGVLGSLMSYPPRSEGHAAYYVPESLADDPSCFPEEARPLQEFCVFSARNYSESFGASAATAVKLLLRTKKSGVTTRNIWRTLSQMPMEQIKGPSFYPERAMLHSYLTWDAFLKLYPTSKPRYASLHMNHVAYMQHRYWRASEPERFSPELSPTDQRFFYSSAERMRYEQKFAHWIESAFRYTDERLGEILNLVDDDTVVLVGTALGVRPFDPSKGEIYNPVVRLVKERELFDAIGLTGYTVLHQMNPDVTVNFADEAAAAQAHALLDQLHVHAHEPLFTVQRKGPQLFLELNMPLRAHKEEELFIRFTARPELAIPLGAHIHEHCTNDQSTSHHKDSGWLLAYSKGGRITGERDVISVTDIAPTILSLYGIQPQAWMDPAAQIAFRRAS